MSRQATTLAPVELSLSRVNLPPRPAPPPKPTYTQGMSIGALAESRRTWARVHQQLGLTDADIEQCLIAYGPYLRCQIARKLRTRDPELPDQLLQEVFLRVQSSNVKYDPARGNELTYLLRITSCVVIDYLRRTRKLASTHAAGDTLEDLQSPRSSTVDSPRGRELRESLMRAVERLPESMRQLAQLQLRGFTLDQMARELGEPVGTIKSRWSRTLNQLRGEPNLRGTYSGVA